MDKDKRIAELEARLQEYEGDPSAEFYKALVEAVNHITVEIKNKTLNLKTDVYADSILTLAEKSGKIFEGLKNGKAAFQQQDSEDKDRKKKLTKAGVQVGI